MMTTRSASCRSTVDAPPAIPSQATRPTGTGRSDAPPRVVAALQRDAVALTWDLTVYQLHEAFLRCMTAPSTDVSDAGVSQELARTRLAAARYAVDDIQAALSRMACGTYGRCEQCGRMITAERLQAAPTARWCAACQM